MIVTFYTESHTQFIFGGTSSLKIIIFAAVTFILLPVAYASEYFER